MRKLLLLVVLLAVIGLFYYSWQGSPGAVPPVAPATDPTYAAQVRQARQQKDAAFRTAANSPLDSAHRAGFQGLRYYKPDAAWRVTARLTRLALPTPEPLPNSGGTTDAYVRWGTAEFELGGQPQRLALLRKQGPEAGAAELFVPFADPSNGQQTYGAGRFLDLPVPAADAAAITLDFNAAYNPFCAYNHDYNCPRPPADNRLTVPVLAGEQQYPGL